MDIEPLFKRGELATINKIIEGEVFTLKVRVTDYKVYKCMVRMPSVAKYCHLYKVFILDQPIINSKGFCIELDNRFIILLANQICKKHEPSTQNFHELMLECTQISR